MCLRVIPIFWFEFLSVFLEKIAKMSKEKNWAKTGPLAAAKGTLAAVKCFVAVKGTLTAARPKGQKRPPRVH